MATLATVQDYVTAARALLQDTDSAAYRYENSEYLRALNMGLLEARRIRPDLYIGIDDEDIQSFSVVDTTAVTFDVQFRSALLYYVMGQVQIRDDEEVTDARASQFLNKFAAQLLTVAS
jgi:hypothetical protein